MSDKEQYFHHAGITEIKKDGGSFRVRIPDRVFREESILKLERPVNWHYNIVSGVLIVTNDFLEKSDYEYTGESTTFTEGNAEYKCTVPKLFFNTNAGIDTTGVTPEYADTVQLSSDGILHFIYNQGMADGDTQSCYVLTENQFDKRFSNSNDWDGSLDQVPKFFS